MTTLAGQASVVLACAGVAALLLGTVAARDWRTGVRFALDLWTGAGLLRLGTPADWQRLAGAAAIVVARHLVTAALKPSIRR